VLLYRETLHNAATHSRVRDELHRNRSLLREQFELQFAPGLTALPSRVRIAAAGTGNLLTQLDSIDLLRRSRSLTVNETHHVLRDSLATLLAPRT
jgi:hypothetical protein